MAPRHEIGSSVDNDQNSHTEDYSVTFPEKKGHLTNFLQALEIGNTTPQAFLAEKWDMTNLNKITPSLC